MASDMVVALDLEGTLISNAVSVFPRPRLYDFLLFCQEHFQRIVIYTSVPADKARSILGVLADEGAVPGWAADLEILVCGRKEKKDLARVGELDKVLLVDDQEAYVLPEQSGRWIPVKEFEAPFTQPDDELARVQAKLLARVVARQ